MSKQKTYSFKQLQDIANQLRKDVIKMLLAAGSGHSAGPLDLAEIFAAMYFKILKHDPKKPMMSNRDRLFLSCGHVCPIRYAAMIKAGYFSKKDLLTLRKLGTKLQGHPSFVDAPALEHSSGPLAQGSSVAVGAAISDKMDNKKRWNYCIVSDAEQAAGQTWEAAMLAGKLKLNNLIFLMDRNNIQIDGYTEDIMPLEPLRNKWESFNWHVQEVDGHNIEQLVDAVNMAKAIYAKPSMIICHTIPGKGVEFMEYEYSWHGKPPKTEEANKAMRQLRSLDGQINTDYD